MAQLCEKFNKIEEEWITLIQSRDNPDIVIIRVKDMIAKCMSMKCKDFEDCPIHEDVAQELHENFTDKKE